MGFPRILLIAAVVVIQGCMPPPRYVEPTSATVATFLFTNQSSVDENLTIYQGATSCTNRTFPIHIPPGEAVKLAVESSHPFTYMLERENQEGFVINYCMAFLTMQPIQGATYRASFRTYVDGSCSVNADRSGVDDPYVAQIKRKFIVPLTEHGSFCPAVDDIPGTLAKLQAQHRAQHLMQSQGMQSSSPVDGQSVELTPAQKQLLDQEQKELENDIQNKKETGGS